MSDSKAWTASAQWLLLGPVVAELPTWLAHLLNTRGSLGQWRLVGLPLKFDADGHPQDLLVLGRQYSFVQIEGEDSSVFCSCTSRGVRAPSPIPWK